MLSVASVKSSSGAANYFAKDDYYVGDGPAELSEWGGKGAEALGLSGLVAKDDFEKVLDGKLPDDTVVNGNANRRSGIVLTFSMPKSASLLAQLGGDKRILDAQLAAVKATMAYLEKHYAQARDRSRNANGEGVVTGKLLYALFQHDTSRALDPQGHIHVVIANLTQMANGAWQALRNDPLWKNNTVIGAAYHAAFREKLTGLDAGELHVAAGSSTILYLLPQIVGAFRAAHPDVRLTLHNVVASEGTDLLREDAVDLVVGTLLDVPADLSYEGAYRFEQRLIAPPGHPLLRKARLELADLAAHPLILPPKRQITWRLVDLVLQQNRVPYTVALEVSGWDVIKQYVAMGMGVSIVPSICLGENDGDRLASRSLAAFFPSRSYGVVVRKGRVLSPQARAFIALIKPDLLAPREYDQAGHSER